MEKYVKNVIKLCAYTHEMSTERIMGKESIVIELMGNSRHKVEENAPFFENRKSVQVIFEMSDLPYLIQSMQKIVEEWAVKQHGKINYVQDAFKK